MADKRPKIDYRKCMACRICVVACPFGCLEMGRTGIDAYLNVFPELAREEACTGCGLCASACPIEVIEMVPRNTAAGSAS
jgi:Na+-translocating ferredoxin:NAD+ oxidoreductase subunit B